MSDVNWLSPKGEFWHRLEQALDVSIIGSELREKTFGQQPIQYLTLETEKKLQYVPHPGTEDLVRIVFAGALLMDF